MLNILKVSILRSKTMVLASQYAIRSLWRLLLRDKEAAVQIASSDALWPAVMPMVMNIFCHMQLSSHRWEVVEFIWKFCCVWTHLGSVIYVGLAQISALPQISEVKFKFSEVHCGRSSVWCQRRWHRSPAEHHRQHYIIIIILFHTDSAKKQKHTDV